MATNPHVKKSSIPRATVDSDRSDPGKSKLRGPKFAPKSKPTQSKPPVNDGLLKEDENAVTRSLIELEADHARMKQTLEASVREAEERLKAMENLMKEREQQCSANLDAAAERTENLEKQVENYEKTLIENDIDPVTGAVLAPTEEEAEVVEKIKKVTKGDVSKMREKLQQLNENSDKYLLDVQNILQDIEELEASSQRAGGPSSELLALSGEDMKMLVQEVEALQKKEEEQLKKKKEKDDYGEELEEEEEEEGESPVPEEKENTQTAVKSDVFITQKK